MAINKKELNNTSTLILQNLSDQNFIAADQSNPWYQFLTQQSTILPKVSAKTVRLIQFRTTVQDTNDRREFAQAIADLFSHLITNFYLNENTLIIVQANGPETLTLVELESILQTIESDFMVKAQAFIGNYWPVDEQLAAIFNEEQAVFAKSTSSVSSLATLALDYYARPQLRKSPLAQQLNTILNQDAEIKDVVIALYQSAGNLSSAAKKLFLHRNTLQYRLERFYEATNLNLKQMDDLVLCYLLITAFND
ncbi:PucR family transcriptional regulator [Lapidilactobacillus luobeiensis]|uniref:PucR family transcriptional regulator n=1 Tax=Lapidilactobacillus luobeiensis TaxID=2950371 RepID=UPI0021C360C3|nr:helix-turn-helix domain-containing protein [Lapidilactobacillus luobeiensis]